MRVRCTDCGFEGDLRKDFREIFTTESEETGVTEFACPSCGGYEQEVL